MSENISFINASKETLMILSCFNDSILEKIPNNVWANLIRFSSTSTKQVYVDTTKALNEQDISEECKDLLSYIYYKYIANETQKQELKEVWNINEENFQNELRAKYNVDNLFKNKSNSQNVSPTPQVQLIKYKKENFFVKFIKRLFNNKSS